MSDLSATRGDSETYQLTITDTVSGDPYDLTGAEIWFTVKVQHSDADADAILAKTTADDVTIDPDQVTNRGKATVQLSAAETAALEPRRYPYDVQVKLTDGTIKTPISGRLVVAADVTRSTT